MPGEDMKEPDDRNAPKMRGGMSGNGGILGFMFICKDCFTIIHLIVEMPNQDEANLIPWGQADNLPKHK